MKTMSYSFALFLLMVLTAMGLVFALQTQVLALAIIGGAILLFCAIGWIKFLKRRDHVPEDCNLVDDDYNQTEADRIIEQAHANY